LPEPVTPGDRRPDRTPAERSADHVGARCGDREQGVDHAQHRRAVRGRGARAVVTGPRRPDPAQLDRDLRGDDGEPALRRIGEVQQRQREVPPAAHQPDIAVDQDVSFEFEELMNAAAEGGVAGGGGR